jgi:hypothetical protein
MIFTSNFAIAGRHPDAVATSQGIPRWFRGRVYKALAPERWMIRIGRNGDPDEMARFRGLYFERILSGLDPVKVLEELEHRAILLCWEPPGLPCHRTLIAEWLHAGTGVTVEEWPRPQFDLRSLRKGKQ